MKLAPRRDPVGARVLLDTRYVRPSAHAQDPATGTQPAPQQGSPTMFRPSRVPRHRLFIPPLANPHARYLTLLPLVADLKSGEMSESERRTKRQVARGLFLSLTPAMQQSIRRRLASRGSDSRGDGST